MGESNEKFVYSHCMGSGCHESCCLKTYVEDGKIKRTERIELTGPETDLYGICQKGVSYPKILDLSERLIYPMKRIGPRGSNEFERISWDQAMKEIGEKLRKVIDEHGKEAVLMSMSYSGYPDNNTPCLHMLMQYRFMHGMGINGITFGAWDYSCLLAQAIDYGSNIAYCDTDYRILSKANHLILWAGSPIGNTRAAGTSRYLLDAQENGAKIVHIDIRYSPTSAKADEFVVVKAGSDAALALAMCNILVSENRFDARYMINHTVAPFLVRKDDGQFLRESDVVEGGDPLLYVAWDKNAQEPIFVPPHFHADMDADLEAVVEVGGIQCETAFSLLRKNLEKWTPEYQEEYTGVAPGTVRHLVDEYMDKEGCIVLEEGIRYINGVEAYRAIQLFAALSGFMTEQGKGICIMASGQNHPSTAGVLNDFPIMVPYGLENAKSGVVPIAEFIEEAYKPEPKYRALLITCGNPVHANPYRGLYEEVLPKTDLVVTYDVQMTETALMSDYVLPDCTTFERMELIRRGNHIILQEPAIEPMGECKSPVEFFTLLAKEVGLEDLFDKSTEEWLELRLQSGHPMMQLESGPLSMEYMKEHKMVRLNAPADLPDCFTGGDFRTPSGRIEFYCEDLADSGRPMTTWKDPYIYSEERKKYPLQLMHARNRFLMQSQLWYDMPELKKLAGSVPELYVNPVDAAERGIADGEIIEVFNERGTIKMKARLSQTVPPGVTLGWYSFMQKHYPEGSSSLNAIGTNCGDPKLVDEFALEEMDMMQKRYAVPEGQDPSFELMMQGRLPTILNAEVYIGGNYDSIWENTCDIRKIEG